MDIKTIVLVLVAALGAISDWKYRKIPNWLTFGVLFISLFMGFVNNGLTGVVNSALGFVIGILILIVPYLLGGMGAGDVKLLGSIGSLVGIKNVIVIFFYSALCGLCLGLIWLAFIPGHFKFFITTGKILPTVDKKQKVPYGVAIFMGTILYIILGANKFPFL